MADRVYTKHEAETILARAIEIEGHGEATSHAELLATAREIGVAPEALEKAAAEVLADRREDQALRALRAKQWRGFFAHLVPFVCVGVLLGFINVATGGFPWAVIPMLAWGIGLASHLFAVAMPDREKLRLRVARRNARAPGASLRENARSSGHESSSALRVGGARVAQGAGADRAAEASAEYEEAPADFESTDGRTARRG